MPKMKTHSGTAKRFKKTGTGKISRKQSNVAHYLEHKSGQRRRRLQKDVTVSSSDSKRIRRLLGG